MKTPKISRSPKGDVIPYYDVAVLGDVSCGKSSIIKRLMSGKFTDTYTPTAAEVYMTTLKENEKRIACLQLFDTAGGFEFPMMLRLTITKCQAFLVVYCVGSQKSLEVAKKQLAEIASVKGKHFPCVLIGNKKDLDCDRKVSSEKGLQVAVQYGCSYIEVSAKDNSNVQEAFQTIVKKIEYTATIKQRLHVVEQKQKLFGQRARTSSTMKSFFNQLSSGFSSDSDSD